MPELSRDALRGPLPAMLTPLTDDERLDVDAAQALADALLDEGQPGLYLAGNTGEGYALDDATRAELFRAVAAVARSRSPQPVVIAHVGSVPTRRAVALAHAAAEAGCDAIAAMAPGGVPYTFAEVRSFYRDLAAAAPLPTFVYHIPVRSGLHYDAGQLGELLELPGVVGMKYTDQDLFTLERLTSTHADRIVLMGADQQLVFGLLAGAVGAVGTTYNLIGPVARKLFTALDRGDLGTAVRAQSLINEFVAALLKSGRLHGFKSLAAERFGWACPNPVAPGQAVPPETYAPMRAALDDVLAAAAALP
jgi:N-acetylneuraminate lyase